MIPLKCPECLAYGALAQGESGAMMWQFKTDLDLPKHCPHLRRGASDCPSLAAESERVLIEAERIRSAGQTPH